MQAILDKLIVKPIIEDNNDSDEFVLNTEKKEKFSKGEVLTVGDKVDKIKKGDVIWYDKHRASKIYLLGETYVAMSYSNVFLVE